MIDSVIRRWRRECFVSKAFFDLDPSSSYSHAPSGNINEIRKDTYADEYFMSQLPTSNVEGACEYDDEIAVKSPR
jgi:hypothetical protein